MEGEMDIIAIIGIIAAIVGIPAAIVQVIDHLQKRNNEKRSSKTDQQKEEKISIIDAETSFASVKPKHNLPIKKKYIGREKEIKKILTVLRPYPQSQNYLAAINGASGIGKSALALNIAHILKNKYTQMTAEERFESIIWVSTKGNVPAFRPLEHIYMTIAVVLGHPAITQLKINQQFDAICNLLVQQRTLLIIDNLETMEDDEIISFLRELPAPTKCIVTSQRRIDIGFPIQLQGMEAEEAKILIESECQPRKLALTAAESKILISNTEGAPLAMILSIAQIAKGFGVVIIHKNPEEPADETSNASIVDPLENINTNVWKLLMALSLFSAGTSSQILGEVADLNKIDLDHGLSDLRKLSIHPSTDKYWMLPQSQEYIERKMNNKEQPIVDKLRHNFAEEYMKIKIESMESAKVNIHAVHLAIDLSDLLAWDKVISDYLRANERAVNRGVRITRIFVLEKKLTYLSVNEGHLHPKIQEILNHQTSIGINVRILWKETVEEKQLTNPEDLIIFDSYEIHVHTGHGGWYLDVDIPTDTNEIELWQQRFSQWLEFSIPWSVIAKE
jgi:DNA replication protein DnaC